VFCKALFCLIFILVLPVMANADDPVAYVLNTNAETLSKINLSTGAVYNDILTIGTDVYCYPNQFVKRDTLAYAIASGTDEIQVINLNTETTEYFINTGVSTNPYWMEFLDEQYLYVTLMMANSVAKIDYRTGTIVHEIPVCKSPEGILIVGDKAYIACSGFDFDTYLYDPGKVTVYDIPGDSVINQIDVGLNPQYLILDTLGRLHVVCTGDFWTTWGWIYIINTDTDLVVDSIYLGGTPGQITLGPDNIAYIASAGWTENGYVFSYNTITGEVYHDNGNPIAVDLNCMAVAAYQDSTCFTGSFTNYVNVIDSTGNYLNSYAVSDGPVHITFNYLPGDANGDFTVNIFDASMIISWLYMDGEKPHWPKWRANVNSDLAYNVFDVTYLISFLYMDGPRPKTGPGWFK